MEAGETASETIVMGSAATVSISTGASLEIGAGVLLTDTTASITEILGGVLSDTTGTPVGTVHDIRIAGSDFLISGTVTITLPYDPTRLPGGASEDDVRAYYFDGMRWIDVGGQVETGSNTVVVTTPHLSEHVAQIPSENPFGLTREKEEAFDKAAAYFADLVAAKDLYKAFTTSDGQHLFNVDFELAKLLATTTLYELGQLPQDAPVDGSGRTPGKIVDEMVILGETLPSHGDEITDKLEAIEKVEALVSSITVGLGVGSVVVGGPLGPALVHVAKHLLVETLVFSVIKVGVVLEYAGEMRDLAGEIDSWLQTADEAGLWPSDWNAYPANEIQIEECRPNYQATGDFYHYQIRGAGDLLGPDYSYAYGNLYQDDAETDFVLALQNLGPFRGGLMGGDLTDYVYVFVEYEDAEGTRASAMRFANPGVIGSWPGICVAGQLELPGIQPGSEVKVKYIFVEDGHLDKRFNSTGTSSFPSGTLHNDPITMDRVYTTDYSGDPQGTFRPGEAIKLTLLTTNHATEPVPVTIPVTYTWSTYDPNGAQVYYLSWDDWSVSMPPGEDEWWLTRGIAPGALHGTYTYTATVSYVLGTKGGNTTFDVQGTYIDINPLEYVMCKGIDDYYRPVDITDTFTTDDDYAYTWSLWEGAAGTPHTITWEWYRPDGTLFGDSSYDFDITWSVYELWCWLSIDCVSDTPGQWSVKTYMDGSYVTTQYFTLVAGAQSRADGEPNPFSPIVFGADGARSSNPQPTFAPANAQNDDVFIHGSDGSH